MRAIQRLRTNLKNEPLSYAPPYAVVP